MEQNNEQQGEGCAEQPTAALLLRAEKKNNNREQQGAEQKQTHTMERAAKHLRGSCVEELERWPGAGEGATDNKTTTKARLGWGDGRSLGPS